MIDSIHIRLHKKQLTVQQVKTFKALLDPHTKKYRNFGVRFEDDKILIWGSLPKYMLGNNVESLPFSKIGEAMQKLSDATGLPLFDGELARVDVAESFLVDNNVRFYFANLLDTPGFQRNRTPTMLGNGVQYKRFETVFSFYNKTGEASLVPNFQFKDFETQGVIRIEFRIMKDVRRVALNNTRTLSVRILTNTRFHKRLAMLWQQHYDTILKKRIMVSHGKIADGKAFDAYLIADLLHTEGRLQQTLDYLHAVAEINNWSRQLKYNVKRRLMSKYKDETLAIPTPYIQELDTVVKGGTLYNYGKPQKG